MANGLGYMAEAQVINSDLTRKSVARRSSPILKAAEQSDRL